MPRAVSRAAAVLLLVGLLSGCTGVPMPTPTPTATPTPTGDGVLRIGTLFSTGTGAGAGQTAAVNAAVREIDAAGGVLGSPVVTVNRDGGDPATVGAAFDALVAKGVDVVIGPSTSESAAVVVPLAAAAHVPLVSPSANAPALTSDGAGWFFRTIPTPGAEGAALAALVLSHDAPKVAVIGVGDASSTAVAQGLGDSIVAADGELVANVVLGAAADLASAAAAAVDEALAPDPDAVVLATADDATVTPALVAALADAGFPPGRLWLAGTGLTDTSAIAAGALAGATAVADGFSPDAALSARFLLEDPGAGSLRYAAEAYDATILSALAASLAHDDGGASIARTLPAASADGIRCLSFGECMQVLAAEPDIDYAGVTGPVDLGADGELVAPGFAVYSYAADNTATFAEWTAG